MTEAGVHLTKTQQKIFDLLSDGACHGVDDIKRAAFDGRMASSDSLVPTHIGRLKKRLNGSGYSIHNEPNVGYKMTDNSNG